MDGYDVIFLTDAKEILTGFFLEGEGGNGVVIEC